MGSPLGDDLMPLLTRNFVRTRGDSSNVYYTNLIREVGNTNAVCRRGLKIGHCCLTMEEDANEQVTASKGSDSVWMGRDANCSYLFSVAETTSSRGHVAVLSFFTN